MKHSWLKGVLLNLLMILSAGLALATTLTPLQVIPEAHATPPNSAATIGLFSESKKSNAVLDSTIGSGGTFTLDVNVTDAGPLKGFDVNVTFASSAIAFSSGSWTGTLCPKAQGCLFDGLLGTSQLVNDTSNVNAYRLSVVDIDSSTPFVSGTGILFRVTFKTKAASVTSVIHITSTSIISNPASVPYKSIDGYFDSRSSPSKYLLSVAPATATVLRTVSGTNSTTTTVSIASPSNVGSITLYALGLPVNSNGVFSPASCSGPCTSTLTISVNGGPRSSPSTTPSGTYHIAVLGNSTATGVTGFLIESSWATLVVKPPKPPSYTFASSGASFTQEAGNSTTVSLTVTLLSGSNDSIALANNCSVKLSTAVCTVTPSTGSFPLSASLNIATSANATVPNTTYRFNATATSLGTYSEVLVVQNITIALTVLKTHDLSSSTISLVNRNFSYQAVSLPTPQARTGTSDKTDPKIKFLDSNSNNLWDSGESVVYDTNANSIFDTGENVISGSAAIGQSLKSDPKLGYIDSNADNTFTPGEYVIYDSNSNNVYDSGEPTIDGLGRLKIQGSVTNLGTVSETVVLSGLAKVIVTSNPNLRFVDSNTNGVYDSGEVVVVDSDGNGLYGSGKHDFSLRFVDLNTNGHWDPAESVIYDSDSNGKYNSGTFHNDIVVAGPVPANNTAVSFDLKIEFVDANANGTWQSGETVFYDGNGSGIYDVGDTIVTGSPPATEPVLVGSAPSDGKLLSFQSLSYADSNFNGAVDLGEIIVQDTNTNGLYDSGEPIATGSPSGGYLLGTLSVAEPLGAVVVASLPWDPGTLPRGQYLVGISVSLSSSACPSAPCEFRTDNNAQFTLMFTQRLRGDTNNSCNVDIVDLASVGASFGKVLGQVGYSNSLDLNDDGEINIVDLVLVAGNFGASC